MKKSKKFIAIFLATVMLLTIGCGSVFAYGETSDISNSNNPSTFDYSNIPASAYENIPDDLPEGTFRVAEGIYATPKELYPMPINNLGFINIPEIVPMGQGIYTRPEQTLYIDSGTKYIKAEQHNPSGLSIRLNFMKNNVFVMDFNNPNEWMHIMTGYVYSLETASYNVQQLQSYYLALTSGGYQRVYNASVHVWTSAVK